MPILDAHHDLAHPVETEDAWSESYYFNCYDPDGDVGFYSRIGIRPNEGTIDVGMAMWIPGGAHDATREVREQTTMIDTLLEVGGITYEMLEVGTSWRITADTELQNGPLSMDVTFESLMPMIGTDGQHRSASEAASDETRKSVGKGHLEQAGRWSGWIDVGGTRTELGGSARGNRDKSWGPRRWGGPKMWRWFSINIDDNTHFGGIKIGTDVGDLDRGWVWKNETANSIQKWDVTSDLADDGVTHRKSYVVATDKSGYEHRLEADVLRVEPGSRAIAPNTTVLNEGLARWTYEGVEGTGISEYLHQLDADARPVVPIR